MKVNFFKKIYLYFYYSNIVKKNKENLLSIFGARVDYISRIYTVLNIPRENIEEPYNIRTGDINSISQNYLRVYSNQIQEYLNNIGLRELFDIYEVKKVDKYSYLIILGFSLFDSKKMANRSIYTLSFVTLIIFIYLIYYTFK